MQTLVPLDTAEVNIPPTPMPTQAFTLSQQLAAGADSATFNYASYGFGAPPTQILPTLVRSDGTKALLDIFPRAWSATTWTGDLSAPTPDGTYTLSIRIIP